jgi:hypothetical protein
VLTKQLLQLSGSLGARTPTPAVLSRSEMKEGKHTHNFWRTACHAKSMAWTNRVISPGFIM